MYRLLSEIHVAFESITVEQFDEQHTLLVNVQAGENHTLSASFGLCGINK